MNTLHLFLILFCYVWTSCLYGASVTEDVEKLHKKAISLQQDGKFEAAFKIYEKNLTLQKSNTINEREFKARTRRNAGVCLFQINEFQQSEQYFNKAIAEYVSIIKEEKETSTQNYKRLGSCFYHRSLINKHRGEFEKAVYDAQEAIFWFRKAEHQMHEIRAMNILAATYNRYQKFNLAKETCFQALKKSHNVKHFNQKTLATIYHTLALAYQEGVKDYNEAAKYYLKSLELTKDSVDLAKTLNNLALVHLKDKDFPKAKDYLNQTIQFKKQIQNHAPYDFSYAPTYENFGDLEIAKQNPKEALNYYQKSIINLTNNFRDTDIFQNPQPDESLYVYSNTITPSLSKINSNSNYLANAPNCYTTKKPPPSKKEPSR